MLLNVLDYLLPPQNFPGDPDPIRTAYTKAVTDALADAADGDRIYIPGVRKFEAPANGWIVDKSLEIFGDGPGGDAVAETGTIVAPYSSTGLPGSTYDVFVVGSETRNVEHAHIHDLAILGPSGSGGRDGIRFMPQTVDRKLAECRLERLRIANMGGTGLRLGKAATFPNRPNGVVSLWASDIEVQGCQDTAVDLQSVYVGELVRFRVSGNAKEGMKCTSCGLVIHACTFESNMTSGASGVVADLTYVSGSFARIDSCEFKGFAGTGTGTGVLLQDVSVAIVSGCTFQLSSYAAGVTGLSATADLTRKMALTAIANRFVGCGTAVRAPSTLVGLMIFPQYCDSASTSMVLPTGALVGEPSSALSNGAGLLVPSGATGADPQFPDNPNSNVQRGEIYYSTTDNVLRARVGNAWTNISTQP